MKYILPLITINVTENNKKKKTMKLPIIISISISILIIILVLFFTVDTKTLNQLANTKIKYEFFAVAVLLNLLYWILWGVRLKVLANAINKKVNIGLWESTKIIIANQFLAGITPSMAGGEPLRIYLLNKDGMSLGSSTATVLGERLLDAIFILTLIPFAFYIFKNKPGISYLNLGLTIGIIVFIMLIISFLYAVFKPEKTKSFLIYISKKFSRFSKKKEGELKLINWVNQEVDNFHNSMMCFSKHKKALLLASIITVIFWSTGFLIASMLLLGLGLPPFFIESYAAQILLIVIIMMPTTPGSSGIAEGSIFVLYGVLLTEPASYSLLGVFVILYRFITYHMNVIVGAIFQYRIFKSVASFSMDMIKTHEEKLECK